MPYSEQDVSFEDLVYFEEQLIAGLLHLELFEFVSRRVHERLIFEDLQVELELAFEQVEDRVFFVFLV